MKISIKWSKGCHKNVPIFTSLFPLFFGDWFREFTKNSTPHLICLFARILRCDNEGIFQYYFIITPWIRTKILCNMGILFPVTSLKNFFPLAENAKIAEDKISSMMKYSWRSQRSQRENKKRNHVMSVILLSAWTKMRIFCQSQNLYLGKVKILTAGIHWVFRGLKF